MWLDPAKKMNGMVLVLWFSSKYYGKGWTEILLPNIIMHLCFKSLEFTPEQSGWACPEKNCWYGVSFVWLMFSTYVHMYICRDFADMPIRLKIQNCSKPVETTFIGLLMLQASPITCVNPPYLMWLLILLVLHDIMPCVLIHALHLLLRFLPLPSLYSTTLKF